jgi:hypothetical protein
MYYLNNTVACKIGFVLFSKKSEHRPPQPFLALTTWLVYHPVSLWTRSNLTISRWAELNVYRHLEPKGGGIGGIEAVIEIVVAGAIGANGCLSAISRSRRI